MQSMPDSFTKKYIFFFLLFGSVKISIWNDDGKRKRSITPASNPARNRKEEKELKINLFKKGRKNFFEVWKAISMEANEAIKKEEIYRW